MSATSTPPDASERPEAPLPPAIFEATWPIDRAGDALITLAAQTRLLSHPRTLPAPAPSVLADPDDGVLDRWFTGAAATLGLEAEAVGSDLASVDDLLRGISPALLRVGPAGRRLLLVQRSGRRTLQVIAPDLLSRVLTVADVRRAMCEPIIAPARADAVSLIKRAGLSGARSDRAVERLLHQRLGDRWVGRAWLLRPSPAAPMRELLRAEGVPVRVVAFVLVYALELGVTITAWWLIGTLLFAGRVDPGWTLAWLLLLLTLVPCRMGKVALIGDILGRVEVILKRRLLVGAMALTSDLTRREGVGLLLGRALETSTVSSLALNGGLVALFAILELLAAVPFLATGPAGPLPLVLFALWAALAAWLVVRTAVHLRAWTDARADLTDHLVEVMIGHRTRLAQQPPDRWHAQDDVRLTGVLTAEQALNRSESLLLALPRGWLLLGIAALCPAFVAGVEPATFATAIGGVLLAQRGLTTSIGGANRLLAATVSLRKAAPMLRATADLDADTQGLMLALPSIAAGQPILVARGLGFRHPGREHPVLRDINLTIAAGDRLLLAGPSGSGKSTLGAIVAGLREPTAGLALLGGLDRATLGLAGWRRRVTAAPQFHDNHVLTATLGFNLMMGRNWPASERELAEARAVCCELGLGDLLDRMPSGLQQMVGETGWQLSHGERSRIFIARALLQQVDLLVLDESFAALDPETLQRALRCVLARARAVLVIAHP